MNCSCPYCTAPFDHDVWGPDDEIEKLQNRITELEACIAAMISSGNAEAAAKAWAGVDDVEVWLASLRGATGGEEVQP